MKKRVLSLVLTVCMLVGVLGGVPINVQANENFKFTLTDDTLTISGQGSLQYIPPELYDEFAIKNIKQKNWFLKMVLQKLVRFLPIKLL